MQEEKKEINKIRDAEGRGLRKIEFKVIIL